MQCDPKLSIFSTADNLLQLPSEVKKKFSVQNIIGETLTKVRTAIVPSTCANGSGGGSNTNSLRRQKKPKKKVPTSQFYDTPSSPISENSKLVVNSVSEFDHVLKMDRDSNKQKSSDELDNGNQIISLESDVYKQSLERQRGTTTATTTTTAPVGILKHRHIAAAASSGDIGNNKDGASGAVHPLNLMSMEDRDIIVIDRADIRESTKNESNVIVVDKNMQQDVDLAELLGSNWPSNAGGAATILNNKQPTKQQHTTASVNIDSVQTKSVRNKSPNPLTHFGGIKTPGNVAMDGFIGGEPAGDIIGTNSKYLTLERAHNFLNNKKQPK